MAESEVRDWVLVWVEDLHRRASKRFWEEEQERIDLGTCCLILSGSLWEVRLHTDCHSGMRIDQSRCFSVKQAFQVVYGYEDEAISRSAQIWTRKMTRLFTSSMAQFCVLPV